MRKSILCAVAVATAAVPAGAAEAKPKPDKVKPYCVPSTVGYNAKGTLVSSAITQTAGADTAKRGDDRYSGDLVVNVTKTNHGGLKGEQTFTLTNGRVKFHPGKDTTPGAGDRVKVSGKFTKFGKRCANPGDPAPVAKKVDIKAKKA